jgi:K+-transporting ATPase ATPase C chain
MLKQLLPAFRAMLLFTVVTGLLYPGAVTAICQLLFRSTANGSLITRNGQVSGSALIGQKFSKPEYFWGRPSAAGNDGYDATASGGSNFGPTNQKLADRVKASVESFRKANPDFTGPLPADLPTASASGLDPHISPASAAAQVARVSKARSLDANRVLAIVAAHTESRTLGFLGEPRVNVLQLNLALDNESTAGGAMKK